MVTIGGKSKKEKLPVQPQFVIQRAPFTNEYALFSRNDKNETVLTWIGDANAATKYNSRYDAKNRTREVADIPETRCFRQLEN